MTKTMKISPARLDNPGQDKINTSKNGLEEIVNRLAHESPVLADLTREQLTALAKSAVFDELKDALKKKRDMARIDYTQERDIFLNRFKSKHSHRAYSRAIDTLEKFAPDCIIGSLAELPSILNLRA